MVCEVDGDQTFAQIYPVVFAWHSWLSDPALCEGRVYAEIAVGDRVVEYMDVGSDPDVERLPPER